MHFGLHFLYEIVYFSTFYFNSNFIWFHINNINFNHTNVCVYVWFFFLFFLCGVWKEPCKRTKKKTLYMQYLKRSTKQKGNFFRNEKCLRDWTTKKERRFENEIEMKQTLQTKSTGLQKRRARSRARTHFFHIRIILSIANMLLVFKIPYHSLF